MARHTFSQQSQAGEGCEEDEEGKWKPQGYIDNFKTTRTGQKAAQPKQTDSEVEGADIDWL